MTGLLLAVAAATVFSGVWPWAPLVVAAVGVGWGVVAAPVRLDDWRLPAVLLALGAGRLISAIAHRSGSVLVILAPLVAAVAFGVFRGRRGRIRAALCELGPLLVALALGNLISGDPNYLCHRNLLAACMIPSLVALIDARRVGWALLVGAGLLSTLSRGGIISAAIAVAWQLSAVHIMAPITAAGVPVLLRVRFPGTISWRWGCWSHVLTTWWSQSPLIGGPPGTPVWPGHRVAIHGHNIFISTIAWSGAVGLTLLVGGLALTAAAIPRHAWRSWPAAGLLGLAANHMVDDRTMGALALLLIAALLAAVPGQTRPPDPLADPLLGG